MWMFAFVLGSFAMLTIYVKCTNGEISGSKLLKYYTLGVFVMFEICITLKLVVCLSVRLHVGISVTYSNTKNNNNTYINRLGTV